jgi:hypothetical protein
MLVIATIVCLGTVAVNNAMIAAKNSLSDAQTTCPPCQETPNTTTVHPLVAELNNTSIFYQVRRRTTHSREAFEAFLYIGGLSGLVVVSVYCSKMWRDKSNFSVQQKQRIKFTQQEPTDEILVKGDYNKVKYSMLCIMAVLRPPGLLVVPLLVLEYIIIPPYL